MALPFKLIGGLEMGEMQRLDGESSNALFEILEGWNTYLKAVKGDLRRPAL